MQVRSVDHNAICQVTREDRRTWAAEKLAAGLRPQPVGAEHDVAFDDGPGLEGYGGRGAEVDRGYFRVEVDDDA